MKLTEASDGFSVISTDNEGILNDENAPFRQKDVSIQAEGTKGTHTGAGSGAADV